MLGIVLFNQGEMPAALDHFARAKALAPRGPAPYFYIGHIYRTGEETDKALVEFTQYVDLEPHGSGAERVRQIILEMTPVMSALRHRESGS
jgi:predicted TPR repeat methyltransferase